MSDWVCIPCLLTLRDEFNLVAPKRDKGEEGTIGDVAHAAGGTSDHLPDEDFPKLRYKDSDHKNEVHALDIDATGPWPDGKGGEAGGWFDRQIHRIIAEERRRWLDPNDMCRLEYIIWRGMIYDKDNDWAGVRYNLSDQHFGHAHFSGRYETRAESDTRTWGVYVPPAPPKDEEIPVKQEDFNNLMVGALKDPDVQNALLDNVKVTDYADPEKPQRVLSLRQWIGYTEGRGQVNEVLDQLAAISNKLGA
jgi:hypothetical protein